MRHSDRSPEDGPLILTILIGKDWQIYRKVMGVVPNKASNLERDIAALLAK